MESRESVTPKPERRPSILLHGALFLVAFVATLAAVRAAVRTTPEVRVVGHPLLHWKYLNYPIQKHDRNVVFVGSSRVFRQLDPRLFDREMRERGHATNSLNFGYPGVWMLEMLFMVDFILDQQPSALEYLVIELQPLPRELAEENYFSLRSANWHDFERTSHAIRRELDKDYRSVGERWIGAYRRAAHFAARECAVGYSLPLVRYSLGLDAPLSQPGEYGGFNALRENEATSARMELLDDTRMMRARIRGLRTGKRSMPPRPQLREILTELVAKVRAAGVEPIFFVAPPTDSPAQELRGAFEEGLLPNLFLYNDPDRPPHFYRKGLMFDRGHLNRRGATLFTKQFAQDLAGYFDRANEVEAPR